MLYRGKDLLDLNEQQMSDVRWKDIAMIFQGAMNALNPVRTVGDQIAEAIACHDLKTTKEKLDRQVSDLLELVGIPASARMPIPTSVFGRNAPAGDDRHGAGLSTRRWSSPMSRPPRWM